MTDVAAFQPFQFFAGCCVELVLENAVRAFVNGIAWHVSETIALGFRTKFVDGSHP
jgi:hypothetical protein